MAAIGDNTGSTDEDLVHALAAGDVSALEILSERHSRPAYSLALRILQDSGWAEEVVQDVWLKLWKNPALYDASRGDLRRWLLSVTHNASVDGLRGRRGTSVRRDGGAVALELARDTGEDPSESAWKSLQAERVQEALAELPPSQRQAVELAYFEGLSQSEIATRTGEPLGTIKTRVRLGLEKLKRSLERVGMRQ